MQIVKVVAKIVDDNSGVFTEIPILLDEKKQVIKPLLDYILKLKRNGKSQSTITIVIKATKLLLEYMKANTNSFSTSQTMFESFSSRLYTGTINDEGLDPSGLFWLPHSSSVAKSYIRALTQLTDWLAEKQDTVPMNPLVNADNFTQHLNYAAWVRKNQQDFLGHIADKNISAIVQSARNVQGKRQLGKQNLEAIEFSEKYFEDFYFKGIGGAKDRRIVLRDQLILLLIHFGGLRISEALHLWVHDVNRIHRKKEDIKVRIYHPESGKAPDDWRSSSGKTTRAAFLKEKYALSPRNTLIGKKHIGWKTNSFENSDYYLEVYWFPTIYGKIFEKLWKDYIRFLTGIERNHPYAFISFHRDYIGEPYTLNAFQSSYTKGLQRIGLNFSKADGLSPHSHRHSYGRRLRRANVDKLVIKKCLHHASLASQEIYTAASPTEVSACLQQASERLLNLQESSERKNIQSWDILTQYGFENIDSNNAQLCTKKIFKSGKIS